MTEPRRSANTGPSVTPKRVRTVEVDDRFACTEHPSAVWRTLTAHDVAEVVGQYRDPVQAKTVFSGLTAEVRHPRRPLTLEEAERGDLPKPFSAEEWRAMAQASKQIT